jgi:hypothetical protein
VDGGQQRTGVCIIRVELQGVGALIRLRSNTDIANVSGESSVVVADPEAALAAVRVFFREMLAAGPQ